MPPYAASGSDAMASEMASRAVEAIADVPAGGLPFGGRVVQFFFEFRLESIAGFLEGAVEFGLHFLGQLRPDLLSDAIQFRL